MNISNQVLGQQVSSQLRSPWRSFWMGGFEGADHVNAAGRPLDMVRASGHLDALDEDYARLRQLHLLTVRESVGWRLSERCAQKTGSCSGVYDFSRLLRLVRSSQKHGLQILWSLMHYGTPLDVDLTNDRFIPRFARFAAAVARFLKPFHDEPPVYTPINEISYLAWALTATSSIHPYSPNKSGDGDSRISGWEMKCRLVRATLAAMDAILEVDDRARFLHIDPLVHVVAPTNAPELADLAEKVRSYQWQAWDMLAGRLEPGLGGHPQALDLIGVNHYHSGQWEVGTEKRLPWHLKDPRRRPFRELLNEAWTRYHRPIIVAETSHFGAGRAAWLNDIAGEVKHAVDAGVPVGGICLYPIIDRPDWDKPAHWHNSGMWDSYRAGDQAQLTPFDPHTAACPLSAASTPVFAPRLLNHAYAHCLMRWQRRLPPQHPPQHQSNDPGTAPTPLPDLIAISKTHWGGPASGSHVELVQLAQHHRVWLIEEPVVTAGPPFVEQFDGGVNIQILRPYLSINQAAWTDTQIVEALPLLEQRLRQHGVNQYLAWHDTPSALPLLAALTPLLVICHQVQTPPASQPPLETSASALECALMKFIALVLDCGGPGKLLEPKALNAASEAILNAAEAEQATYSNMVHVDSGHTTQQAGAPTP